MPDLYLIRHAKSSWDDPRLEDSIRPLSGRGNHDAPMMAERLKTSDIRPDLIISSPALRARQTAEIMAKVLEFPKKQIKFDWEVYDASYDGLLQVINRIEKRFQTVFLFGHNPGMAYFANALGNITIGKFPTTGIAGLRFSKSWKKIKYGSGELFLFDYPKKPTE